MVNKNERHLFCITWVFRRLYFPSLLHNKYPIPFTTLKMHCFLQTLWILRKQFSLCWITLTFIALNMSLKSYFPNHPGFRGKPLFLSYSFFSLREKGGLDVFSIHRHILSLHEDSFKYGDKWLFTVWGEAIKHIDDNAILCVNVFAAVLILSTIIIRQQTFFLWLRLDVDELKLLSNYKNYDGIHVVSSLTRRDWTKRLFEDNTFKIYHIG